MDGYVLLCVHELCALASSAIDKPRSRGHLHKLRTGGRGVRLMKGEMEEGKGRGGGMWIRGMIGGEGGRKR